MMMSGRLLGKPCFELAAKGVGLFRLGRYYILWQGVPGLWASDRESSLVQTLLLYDVGH